MFVVHVNTLQDFAAHADDLVIDNILFICHRQHGFQHTVLLATMGGSNFIHHAAGMLESMLTVAYEQYVIDDEIIGMCCKVLQGIDVDAEHLALEAIDEVGPGGNFIASDHTFAHMRTEYFTGNGVTDRKIRDDWEQDGSQDAATRAREIARTILAKEENSYIPSEYVTVCRSLLRHGDCRDTVTTIELEPFGRNPTTQRKSSA